MRGLFSLSLRSKPLMQSGNSWRFFCPNAGGSARKAASPLRAFLLSVATLQTAGELRKLECEQLVGEVRGLRCDSRKDFDWRLRRSQIASISARKLASDLVVLRKAFCPTCHGEGLRRKKTHRPKPVRLDCSCSLKLELKLQSELQLARRAGIAVWEAGAADG